MAPKPDGTLVSLPPPSNVPCLQVVLTGTLTPAYLLWSGLAEAPLHGAPVPWAKLSERLTSELPTLLPTSFFFWLPFHVLNFTLVPAHGRVAFISSVSVAWGGYLSYVSHGRGGGHSPGCCEPADASSTKAERVEK